MGEPNALASGCSRRNYGSCRSPGPESKNAKRKARGERLRLRHGLVLDGDRVAKMFVRLACWNLQRYAVANPGNSFIRLESCSARNES